MSCGFFLRPLGFVYCIVQGGIYWAPITVSMGCSPGKSLCRIERVVMLLLPIFYTSTGRDVYKWTNGNLLCHFFIYTVAQSAGGGENVTNMDFDKKENILC